MTALRLLVIMMLASCLEHTMTSYQHLIKMNQSRLKKCHTNTGSLYPKSYLTFDVINMSPLEPLLKRKKNFKLMMQDVSALCQLILCNNFIHNKPIDLWLTCCC